MPGANTAGPAGRRPTTFERLRQASWLRRLLGTPLLTLLLSPARGNSGFNRFVRYSLVSGVAIVISQVVILVCTWIFHLSGIAANTLGALAATPASYELNRKWAWGKSGKSHMWREVVPFWSLSLAGFLASTGTVELADNLCHSHHVLGLERSLAIMGSSLFAYGVIWIVKFVIFNRLFRVHPVEPGGAEPLVGGSPAGPVPVLAPSPEPVAVAGEVAHINSHTASPGTPRNGASRPSAPAWDERTSVPR